MASWRDAGFPDEEGRRVRNWVISRIKSAEEGMAAVLADHPTGLEEKPARPDDYLQFDDPDYLRFSVERTKWQGVLDRIDHGGSADFLRAHAAWTKATRDEGATR